MTTWTGVWSVGSPFCILALILSLLAVRRPVHNRAPVLLEVAAAALAVAAACYATWPPRPGPAFALAAPLCLWAAAAALIVAARRLRRPRSDGRRQRRPPHVCGRFRGRRRNTPREQLPQRRLRLYR